MDDLKLCGQNENQIKILVNTLRIISEENRMEFGLTVQHLKWKKYYIERWSYNAFKSGSHKKYWRDWDINKEKEYKYLAILKADPFKDLEMK